MHEIAAFVINGAHAASGVDERVEGLEEPTGSGGDEKRRPAFGISSFSIDSGTNRRLNHERVAHGSGLKGDWKEEVDK